MIEASSQREDASRHRKPRVTFYVQHLLGIGHLARAFRVARGLAEDAFAVEVVVGGSLPPGLDAGHAAIVQLPSVRAGETGFSSLVHADGKAFDAEAQAQRREMLLEHFDRFAPDILVLEAFPFGRRQMRFELMPLLEHAKARRDPPLIVSSVRDILQENRRGERISEMLATVERSFDLILVHGDPSLITLEQSFPEARAFAGKVAYTGLVSPPVLPPRQRRFGAVVSVGGGAVGGFLLQSALAARPLTPLRDEPWLFLTGPNLPHDIREQLDRSRTDGVVVHSFLPDLAEIMSEAAVSISQAGYNTVADILAAGSRSVLIPYAANGETEQTRRAMVMDKLGRAVAIEEQNLTPASLARAVERALHQPIGARGIDMNGVEATVDILLRELRRR